MATTSLTPEQQRVLTALQEVARQRNAAGKRTTGKQVKAGVETGLVENNLTNRSGGDGDSSGWRQERASLYDNPDNLVASINRFYDETGAVREKYGTAGALAAAVQRPRADLRGRYQQRSSQAEALLGGASALTRAAGASASPGGVTAATTTTQETTPASGDPADVAGFLQQLLTKQQPAQMQTTALTTPAIAAAPPVAAGYQAPASGGGVQAATQPDLTQVAAALASTVTPQQTTSTTSTSSASSGGGNAAPADVSAAGNALVQTAVQNANLIDSKHLPYLWGGGHGGKVSPKNTGPLDCSGAVSAVLGIDPRVSGDFEKFGSAGRSKDGKGINIYANSGHVLMEIDGHFFGTSKSNPGGGAGWIPRSQLSGSYLKNFTVRHLAATSG